MKKIPTIFERDWDGDRSRVLDKPAPGCEWVFAGEGRATRKYDGTGCMLRDGRLYKRHEVRVGKQTPERFEAVERDEETGNVVGWVPIGDGPEDRWHREALGAYSEFPDGTYELCGPKVQRNPEGLGRHELVPHGAMLVLAPRSFQGLREFFETAEIEGVVWHHPDGRMAKIKARDFGIKRGNRS